VIKRLCGILLVCSLLSAPALAGQRKLSPTVRAFVKVDAPVVVLNHVRVIDGTGAPARNHEDQAIVIVGDKIQSIGPAASVTVPAGAQVLDLRGYTAIPGLVGMHNHLFFPGLSPRGSDGKRVAGAPFIFPEMAFSFPRLYLAGGVTSLRTTGSVEPYTDLALKQQIDAGLIPGPKMHITGPYLEGRGSFAVQLHELNGPEDAARMVNYWADTGVTSFKAYMHITRAELARAVAEAHKRGLKVTGHLCAIGFREAAAIGIDDLEHGLLVDTEFVPDKKPDVCPSDDGLASLEKLDVGSAPVQETIRDLVAHHTAVTSTLPVFELLVPGRPPLQPRVLEAMAPEFRAEYLANRERVHKSSEHDWSALFRKEMEFERAFHQAGGLLLAGPDPTGIGGVVAGYGDQREVELLVEAGLAPEVAIQVATFNGAQFLGEAESIGSLAPGKQADIVVVKGNPAGRIADVENVEIVFLDGVGYDPAKLAASVQGSVGLR